jgi:adenosylmethionine-8-amino-7-oxononanoate aminotransferase
LPLVLDEVMTGFGRTGAAFAFQRAGIEPDLICVAKGLTGGNLPLAATLARESFFAAFASDDRSRALLHGHSYTANPIACAAALASLAILEGEQLSQRALDLERRYRSFIEAHAARLGLVAPRALGGILAFELPGTGDGDYFHPRATALAPRARAAGLFVRPLGNTVYLMPPLTIDDSTLARALDALASAVEGL